MTDTITRYDALIRFSSLVIFRGILKDSVISAFYAMLESESQPVHKRVGLYSEFANRLMDKGGNWSEYLLSRALYDENRYVQLVGGGFLVPPEIRRTIKAELEYLEAISQMTSAQIAAEIGCPVPLAHWDNSPIDFKGRYFERLKSIKETGYGIFAEYHMFILQGDELEPVLHPDPIRLDMITGYEREREAIMTNTLALLEGRPAANILLYGDSGTGKSACVKAAVNELSSRGLRLIELRKDQLDKIPMLIDRLSGNPLKFILFIDDLSSSNNIDSFIALKAVLEGSISAKAPNVVICATSSRRYQRRDDTDINLPDTLEEFGSLSDRFGLIVTFSRPDRELYLGITQRYFGLYGIGSIDGMTEKAEAFAIRRGGRSARTARQFAESVAARNLDYEDEDA